MRVAIVGSREYPQCRLVVRYVHRMELDDVVVSGGALGVDYTAESAAKDRGMDAHIYRANWKLHGRRAGFIRNKQIVDYADRVVAFWDGSSSGTAHTIQLTRLARKPLEVYGPDGQRMPEMEGTL